MKDHFIPGILSQNQIMSKLFGPRHSIAQTSRKAFFAENKRQHHQFLHTFSLLLLLSAAWIPSGGLYQILKIKPYRRLLPQIPFDNHLQVQINLLCPHLQKQLTYPFYQGRFIMGHHKIIFACNFSLLVNPYFFQCLFPPMQKALWLSEKRSPITTNLETLKPQHNSPTSMRRL